MKAPVDVTAALDVHGSATCGCRLQFQVASSGVGLGEHIATVAVSQSGTMVGQANVTLVVVDAPALTFINFAPDNLGNTMVSAQVAVDYVPALTDISLNATLIGAGLPCPKPTPPR